MQALNCYKTINLCIEVAAESTALEFGKRNFEIERLLSTDSHSSNEQMSRQKRSVCDGDKNSYYIHSSNANPEKTRFLYPIPGLRQQKIPPAQQHPPPRSSR